MVNNSDELLQKEWNKHWSSERYLTLPGKILCPRRIEAMKRVITGLDINNAIDVGCGFGYLLEVFKELQIDYVGIDKSQNSIEMCKHLDLNARLGGIESEENHYDLVASEGMLEHFLNFEPYAKHMMRISRRYVLLMQPNHDSFTGMTLAYLARVLRGEKCVLEYNYQIKDFISVFDNHNFKIIKNEPLLLDTSRLLLFEQNSVIQY